MQYFFAFVVLVVLCPSLGWSECRDISAGERALYYRFGMEDGQRQRAPRAMDCDAYAQGYNLATSLAEQRKAMQTPPAAEQRLRQLTAGTLPKGSAVAAAPQIFQERIKMVSTSAVHGPKMQSVNVGGVRIGAFAEQRGGGNAGENERLRFGGMDDADAAMDVPQETQARAENMRLPVARPGNIRDAAVENAEAAGLRMRLEQADVDAARVLQNNLKSYAAGKAGTQRSDSDRSPSGRASQASRNGF